MFLKKVGEWIYLYVSALVYVDLIYYLRIRFGHPNYLGAFQIKTFSDY